MVFYKQDNHKLYKRPIEKLFLLSDKTNFLKVLKVMTKTGNPGGSPGTGLGLPWLPRPSKLGSWEPQIHELYYCRNTLYLIYALHISGVFPV